MQRLFHWLLSFLPYLLLFLLFGVLTALLLQPINEHGHPATTAASPRPPHDAGAANLSAIPTLPSPLAGVPNGLTSPAVRFLLGEASTRYAPVPAGRVHNLQLATRRLNGLLLPPGAEFSFNDKIGPYTEGNGYRSAPSIVGNKFVPGVGGGVCQVAGTLYDAALGAGLKVLERHPHTLTVGYLPPGFDATVVPGGIDLRLANTNGYPVVIMAEDRDGTLTVAIWGPHPSSAPGRLETRILQVIPPPVEIVIDPSLPAGTKVTDDHGQPGYTVERWLLRDGHRLPLSTDHYLARPTVVRLGPPAAVREFPAPHDKPLQSI